MKVHAFAGQLARIAFIAYNTLARPLKALPSSRCCTQRLHQFTSQFTEKNLAAGLSICPIHLF